MKTAHVFFVVVGLVGLVTAQALPAPKDKEAPVALRAQILDGSGLGRFDTETQPASGNAVTRLNELLIRLTAGSAVPRAGALLRTARSSRGEVVLARGTTEQVELAQAVLVELKRDELPRARLQCTLLTLPVAAASAHGLKVNVVTATDVAAAGRLARDAIKHQGTLHNLPEATVAPLAPFTVASPGKAKGEGAVPIQVHGEMVPLAADQVGVGARLVRSAAGPNRPETTVGDAVFRLRAGESAMVMTVEGTFAVVLVVRCVEIGRETPAAAPTGR
ncbi:MAG: hypothetical protein WAT39_02410 [Planctomycetota bacterium]